MAQAIYREWFVHFRYPGHEDDELVDSPLGPIPERLGVVHMLGDLVGRRAERRQSAARDIRDVPATDRQLNRSRV